jgi:hypothetical protein
MPERLDSMSPAQRRLRARIGAYSLHATHDGTETTAKARAAFLARFEREVDPDKTLDPADRAKRADAALKAHMSRMALGRVKARAGRQADGAPKS